MIKNKSLIGFIISLICSFFALFLPFIGFFIGMFINSSGKNYPISMTIFLIWLPALIILGLSIFSLVISIKGVNNKEHLVLGTIGIFLSLFVILGIIILAVSYIFVFIKFWTSINV